ncbi:MAG: AAA family ATPase [Gemella sp.]|nr:AAA family ATPase [Gemella sp.]
MILRKINFKIDINNNEYPFNLEWLRNLKSIEFKSPVTFVVGNNGVGKSTLLEALAINVNSTNLSQSYYNQMIEYDSVSRLSDVMRCEWSIKNNKGFFFRADDFLNYIRLAIEDSRMPYTFDDGKTPYARDIKHLSHGQAFLAFFNSRLGKKSLYILDEPESPLSPQNQLAFMRFMKEAVEQGSQFIIASHSPILLAYPDADIISISESKAEGIEYDDIENVKFMKSFMKDPNRFIYYNFLDEK